MRKMIIALTSIALLVGVVLMGCDNDSARQAGEEEQESVMQRARDSVPTPQIDNFLTRKAVAEWMERMDTPSKTFYIYVMSDTGSIVHYFVAQYRPVSVSTYLTPTEERVHGTNGAVALSTNALDGTYYGEGAADQYFFFDAETDAYIELKGLNYIVSDQPMNVDAPKITIGSSDTE